MPGTDPTAERHERVSRLLLEVCDLAPSEREAVLRDACASDPLLRDEIESLIAYDHDAAEAFLMESADREIGAAAARLTGSQNDGQPARIGPYRIRGTLGEGGMGVVYLAEPEGSPGRLVALKVVKLGMDTKQVLARFDAERRLLEAMSHPSIAAIFDAGTTEDGRPYFAMEYVDGFGICRYCDENLLGVRARLELFVRVCEAVGYAHARGIVHRDIKPSNVLVSGAGDDVRPKIIDFGVAKATKHGIAPTTLYTAGGILIGTPEYMSPEQADMGAVDARSDVYSLGVLLYELLTGVPPFERDDLRDAGLQEVLRTIREVQPAAPSRRVRALAGRALRLAERRSTDVRSLAADLGGGLDRIVMKALEKDKTHRYGSAEEMAADVSRYLRGERVQAGPASVVRTARLALSRHPTAILACGAALLLIAVALASLGWMARNRGIIERLVVRREAARLLRMMERLTGEQPTREALDLFESHPEIPDVRLVAAQSLYRESRATGRKLPLLDAEQMLREVLADPAAGWIYGALLYEMTQGTMGTPPEGVRRSVPDTAEAWYLRSMATLDLDRGIECARKAVSLDDEHSLAWERLAGLYEARSEYSLAFDAVSRAIALVADRYDSEMFRAHVLLEAARYGEAREAYAAIIANASEEWIARGGHPPQFFRAVSALCVREYDRAFEDYTAAIGLKAPKMSSWHFYHRAAAAWMSGRPDTALEDYSRFLELFGPYWCAEARRFVIRQQQARDLEALGWTEKARSVAENSTAALNRAKSRATPDHWENKVLGCLLGEVPPEDLVAAGRGRGGNVLCEACYYAGEACLMRGEKAKAMHWFRESVATRLALDPHTFPPMPMSEYHLARWRLDQLGQETPGLTSSPASSRR